MLFQLGQINSFQNNPIRDSLPGGETATIFFNYSDYVGGTYVWLEFVMAEGDYYCMFEVVEDLVVVSFYEFF